MKLKTAEMALDILSPHIQLYGDRQASAEGCKGVLYCDDTRIELNMGKYRVVISGSDLHMGTLSAGDCMINGKLTKLEFEC